LYYLNFAMERQNYDTVLFIDLRPSLNEQELAAICSEFGRVTLCEIIDDLPKIGIVSMGNSKEAVSLLNADKVRSICEFCAPLSQYIWGGWNFWRLMNFYDEPSEGGQLSIVEVTEVLLQRVD
ncbi:hypothetical protein T11_13494, partial [Trichinella zimbabwensis]